MACGLIQPRLKANSKKINKVNEMPMRQLNAVTVRLDFPSSRTRKARPLPRAIKITNMVIIMMVLVNICYTPMRWTGEHEKSPCLLSK